MRSQSARHSRLRRTGRITCVAESDLPRSHAPPFHVVGGNALQLELIQIENRLVARVGQHAGQGITKTETRDLVAIERGNLPHHVVPLVIDYGNGIVPSFVLVVRQQMRAFVVQRHVQRNCGRAVDIGKHPHRDAVVLAPVFRRRHARGHKILPVSAALNAANIICRSNAQRRPPFFHLGCRERHRTLPRQLPVRKVFHPIEHARAQHVFLQLTVFSPGGQIRLHRHCASGLLRRCPTQKRGNDCKHQYHPPDRSEGGTSHPSEKNHLIRSSPVPGIRKTITTECAGVGCQ